MWCLKQPGFQLVDFPTNRCGHPAVPERSQEFELPDVVGCVLSTRLKEPAMGPCQCWWERFLGKVWTVIMNDEQNVGESYQNDGHIMDDGRTTS